MKAHTPPTRRSPEQAWEFVPRCGDVSIRRPAGLNLPKVQVLPNQIWRAAGDEHGMARYTGVVL